MRVRARTLLFYCAFALPMTTIGCTRVERGDACGLLTKNDVQKVLGTPVRHMIIESPHAMSVSQGRVMQTTASCEYSLDPVPGKPSRVIIHVDAYGDHAMVLVNWGPWKGAQSVIGIGDEALQTDQLLRVLKGDVLLVIETPHAPAEPTSDPAAPAEDIQLYPKIQIELARIALGRL